MGSLAYGVSQDESDIDIYGWCIPPREYIFPHISGNIPHLGPNPPHFEQTQDHHIAMPGVTYDVTVFNFVKYLQLVAENNPNMIDSLFVPDNCVTFCDIPGGMLREERRALLHKGSWAKFKGYSQAQMRKIRAKGDNVEPDSRRAATMKKYGFDVKKVYHAVRLIGEIEQIMTTGDLNLQLNNEYLKSIRAGDVPLEDIERFVADKEAAIDAIFPQCKLPEGPNWKLIKALAFQILEEFYGSHELMAPKNTDALLLNDLKRLVQKYS